MTHQKFDNNVKVNAKGGSPGLVVMEDNSCLRGCGFESQPINWMDMIFFPLICCKNCIVFLKRLKIN